MTSKKKRAAAAKMPPATPPEPKVDENEKAAKELRHAAKKAQQAMDVLAENIATLRAARPEDAPALEGDPKALLSKLRKIISAMEPPAPRKCKEYRRALQNAVRGEVGIHPDDVMRFCRCSECHALREKNAVDHPLTPKAVAS